MTFITSFILFFSSIFVIIPTFCYGVCIESDRVALLQFKNGLSDPSHRLSDWVSDDGSSSDCCRWTGVICHNVSFHVVELHLRTLSPEEYYGPDRYYLPVYADSEYEEYYKKTAFGGKVSSSLLELKHLSYLDLSFNDFRGVPIPKFIGSLQSLRYLNLSRARFGGMIPPQLGNLSNLHYLNLGHMSIYVEKLDWISSLSSLEFLDMSYVNLSQSFDWLKVISSLPSLLELHLSRCNLPNLLLPNNLNMSSSLLVLDLSKNHFRGPFPNGLQNMTSPFLRELDLSSNRFNSSIPDWLYDLTNLQLLNLKFNQLQGQTSSVGIGNLTSLVTFDLSWNPDLEFEKRISVSFQNFCHLRSLDLSFTKLNREMNDIMKILSSGCVSNVLQSLSLGPLSGYLMIPTSFKHLCHLRSLSLLVVKLNQEINEVLAIMSSGCVSNVLQSLEFDYCQLSGHLTDDLSYFKNLIKFDISSNSISGPIPLSLGEMNSLKYVDLSNNRLEGEVSHIHFANLTRLTHFYASNNNNISLRVSSNWIPPLQLRILALGSWRIIGSQFPKWLRLLEHLTYLDLSNSGISTLIPIWFWDSLSNYDYLDVSHNQMHGSVPNIPFFRGTILDLPLIHLNSNNFSGTIPYFSSNVSALDLSNNSFSGSLFHFLCNNPKEEKQMGYLNLERNFLHDEIPDCWSSWKNLEALKLSNNKFSGKIPNSIGTLSFLQSLHLRNNNLSGEIPSTIQNCTMLFLLDLSENDFVGNIPAWTGDKLADLKILGLRRNKFDGHLPKELCHLVSLQILDLAHNSFSGTIPSCFSNFTRMVTRNDSTGSLYATSNYDLRGFTKERTSLVIKGNMMEYSNTLGLVRSIDLSDNKLSGEIPTEITSLEGLLSLNLSQNALIGRIPDNIGDMKGLEAIDFSHNKLSGEIPQSMSTLTFLSLLDLSFNNLTGRIPSGTQLHSFNSSSFIGNQLCGLPLTKNCSVDNTEPNIEEEDEDEVDIWFYLSIVSGFVFGFWGVVGSLVFMRRWRHFYFRSVYELGEKIWWNCFRRFH